MLDPVARRDFMAAVMSATARDGMSVLLSSHVLAELKQVAGPGAAVSGRVRLAGEVAGLLAGHGLLTGPDEGAGRGTQPDRMVVREAAGDPGSAGLAGLPGKPGGTCPGLPARALHRISA